MTDQKRKLNNKTTVTVDRDTRIKLRQLSLCNDKPVYQIVDDLVNQELASHTNTRQKSPEMPYGDGSSDSSPQDIQIKNIKHPLNEPISEKGEPLQE